MEPERKVVATIAPVPDQDAERLREHQELWNELVKLKAKLAMLMNDYEALTMRFDELKSHLIRQVKRIDGAQRKNTLARMPR